VPLLPLPAAPSGLPTLPAAAGAALGATARRVAGPLLRWSAEAQLTSRRNAMVASTALAQRRAEREEVEEVLAALRTTSGVTGRATRGATRAATVRRPAAVPG